MVRQPAASEAAGYGKERCELSVGLHLDLGEWVWRSGEWQQAYAVVALDDPDAVLAEVGRQLEAFRQLMCCEPTHIDSHQHVHRQEPVLSITRALAAQLGVPLRDFAPRPRYAGGFYGLGAKNAPFPEGITCGNLIGTFSMLPAGVTEMGCHPGLDEELDSAYRDQRLIEVSTLCAPRVRSALQELEIDLISFRELNHSPPVGVCGVEAVEAPM
jgi:predicted glycoside hydrolase/deacetylase ChbG (UPF0249 family)